MPFIAITSITSSKLCHAEEHHRTWEWQKVPKKVFYHCHGQHLIPSNTSLCFRDFLLWALGWMLERGETGAAGLIFFHKVNMETRYTWQDFKDSYRPGAGHHSTYRWEGEEWCIAFFCLKWMLRTACKQALLGCLRECCSAGLSSAGPYFQVSSAFLGNERWTEAYGFLALPKWNRESSSWF